MKRTWIAGLLLFALVLSGLSAGYSSAAESQGADSNILIAYFSRVGNTDFPDDIDAVTSASLLKDGGKLYGNTQYVATMIQQRTGGDLFLIETEEKYPSVYEQIDEQGGEEHRNGVRPKLASHVDNMDDYSVIFLGYPIWYYDLPMAVYSFLEEYDLSGKTIIPFVTSGASGFTGTLTAIQGLQPNADVRTGGFDVKHSKVAEVKQEDVDKWINNLPDFQPPVNFSDVSAGAWYADAVTYCQQHGIMNGTTATTFAPDGSLTRAMLAAVFYRMSGSPAITNPPAFTDTVEGAWYMDAVSWAAKNSVISGYGGGTFGVNDPTTREQAVTILWRYAGSPAKSATTDFADVRTISTWAQSAVRWADANGILDGMVTNQRFNPKASVKRSEVASMLYHYLTSQKQLVSKALL
ncbi:MAG: flavodoxin [Oscillibacter sp.]|nr:flavodoxin [Oscillibacter sp.]